MKKALTRTFLIAVAIYAIVCIILYFIQERLIFHPQKLDKSYVFKFDQPFEEITYHDYDNEALHGLLFKADSSKGLIFYLHGNAGSLATWGRVAKTYTDLHYDVYIPDYPGYGKSTGHIYSQQQLYNDLQFLYEVMEANYGHDKMIVLGYSVGTGLAAQLAATNSPRLLILQAPYYSLTDMMQHNFPGMPTFLLKYKFPINENIRSCKMPVAIFHGDADEVIYYGSSLKLKKLFKKNDTLITLHGQGHNGITDNADYKKALKFLLN